nr:hypothetical protein ISGA_13150 [Gordonia sp. NB41Y]
MFQEYVWQFLGSAIDHLRLVDEPGSKLTTTVCVRDTSSHSHHEYCDRSGFLTRRSDRSFLKPTRLVVRVVSS